MTPDAHERARGMPLAAADETAAYSFPGTAASLTAPRRLTSIPGGLEPGSSRCLGAGLVT